MSQLTKTLEMRIRELTKSIEADQAKLAAYEHVLHMERSVGSAVETAPEEPAPSKPVAAKEEEEEAAVEPDASPAEPEEASGDVPLTTNKTTMVANVVKSYGSAGASPKTVDAFFSAHNISRSKNLVYNTLSYLVAQKKLRRQDGLYYSVEEGYAAPQKRAYNRKTVAAPATAKKKRRLSPEGLKRIKDALKKRWAAKKIAEK